MISDELLRVMLFGGVFGSVGAVRNGDGSADILYGAVTGAAVTVVLYLAYGRPVGDGVLLFAAAALVAPTIVEWLKRQARGLLRRTAKAKRE